MKTFLSGLLIVGFTTAATLAHASGPRSGEDIYNAKCVACHTGAIPGAAKLGDVAGWEPAIARGIDVMYSRSISGYRGMPAKGLCLDCTDDEIKAAVDYIVEQSQE